MKALLFILLQLSCLLISFGALASDERKTSTGKEFIFSFSPNNNATTELSLMISSEFETSGAVSIPRIKTNIFFEVKPGEVTRVVIPYQMANLPRGVKSDYGISVTSEDPITIYGLNRQLKHTDAFLALPIDALGSAYYAIGYYGSTSANPSQAAIVGVHDDTTIEIVSPARTSSAQANVKQTIKLNKMETFLLSAYSTSNDITGTKITSDKPIAVTSGSKCSIIPKELTNGCDHLVEMLPPVNSWGKSFITYPLETRKKGDLIRILAGEDETEIVVNGRLVKTLNAGGYFDLMPSNEFNLINTSKPSLVAQYALTTLYDGVVGDPFMMLIPPVEQSLSSYTFATSDQNIESHYINVVIRTTGIETLILDGSVILPTMFTLIGDGVYSAAKIKIDSGTHSIKASIPFALYVYGFGDYESYGYPGGMATEVINVSTVDYRDVRVVSTLGQFGIDLDVNSFSVEPSRVYEEQGAHKVEWHFDEFSIGQVKNLNYEVVARDLEPGETRVVTSSLEMFYKDLEGVEHRRLLGEQSINVPASLYGLDIALDKVEYRNDENVSVNVIANNLGEIAADTSVITEIRDSNDILVAQVGEIGPISLPIASTLSLGSQTYELGNIYPGNYYVVAVMSDLQGKTLAEARQEFVVINDVYTSAEISVVTDKIVYKPYDLAKVTVLVENLADNRLLDGVSTRLSISDANGVIRWQELNTVSQLAAKSQDAKLVEISLRDTLPGLYIAQAELLNEAGHVIDSAQTEFNLLADVSSGLVARISVLESSIEVGNTPRCILNFDNNHANPFDGLFRLRIANIESEESLYLHEINLQLAAQHRTVMTPSLPPLFDAAKYACILERLEGDFVSVEDVVDFVVNEKPVHIDVTGDIYFGEKSRLLILLDEDAIYHNDLEAYLLESQWTYTVTYNLNDFKSELITGSYGVYVIASSSSDLDSEIKNALSDAVEAGSGLLVIGNSSIDYSGIEEALGISIKGAKSYQGAINVLKDDWVGDVSISEFISQSIIDFNADTAEVLAEYNELPVGVPQYDPMNILGNIHPYNCFVFGNFFSLSSSIDGRLAVGGDLTLGNYTLGLGLANRPLSDVVTVGGDATFQSGSIFNGSLIAAGSVDGVSDAIKSSLAPGASVRGRSNLPIDFLQEKDKLEKLSAALNQLPQNGIVKFEYGTMTLEGDCSSGLQVFNVSAETLGLTYTLTHRCIPDTATVLVNIDGKNTSIQSLGMQSFSAIRERVIFNFPTTEVLNIKYVGIEGTLLAPFADVIEPAGRVSGQIIAKSWRSSDYGYMSIHNDRFAGRISIGSDTGNRSAISSNRYGLGNAAFAGFDWLDAAYSHPDGVAGEHTKLFGKLLDYLDPLVMRINSALQLNLIYRNNGENPVEGRIRLIFPEGVGIVNAGEFSFESVTNSWIMSYHSGPGMEANQQLYVKPQVSVSEPIKMNIEVEVNGVWAPVTEKLLYINN